MLTHIDCFAGVGGIATGFHAAGFKTKLAIEKVSTCVETYRANHPDVPVINADIRNVTRDMVKDYVSDSVDLVTAGMPCETFSTAGKSSRSFYDHRQTLFEEGLRVADVANAKMILFENVPGFATKRLNKGEDKLVIDYLLERVREYGFSNVHVETLNAKDFGVPQSRQRLFILASRDKSHRLFAPKGAAEKTTVADAFFNLPTVDTNGPIEATKFLARRNYYTDLMANSYFWRMPSVSDCTYQKSPKHRIGTIKRFEMIRVGEGLKSLFDRHTEEEILELQSQKVLPKKWYIQRNRRLDPQDVSPTVTSHCIDELLHPNLNRAITVREAARLQSFPDAYDFVGGPEICPHMYETQDKYEQIGDAVPPLMAYYWAKSIREILEK